ncbi:hypothetical protein F5884DRAFT_548403 [Xylogone sp. PMI_703]|nr:hypothetical protein F5884DRAFT_548403 [Xylogone sp. PMI_703]
MATKSVTMTSISNNVKEGKSLSADDEAAMEMLNALPQSLSALNLEQSTKIQSPLIATQKGPAGIDSGYVSRESSLSQGVQEPNPSQFTTSDGHFRRKTTILRQYDGVISKEVQNRFNDLVELFGKPLSDYAFKNRLKDSIISIKLKTLGENQAAAKPSIVVMCDKAVMKRVKQFFNQRSVKLECQGYGPDYVEPSFQVVYYDRPPRKFAAEHPLVHYRRPLFTKELCGRIIQVDTSVATATSQYATIGGVIKVVTAEGELQLYAMTAGHIVNVEDQSQPESPDIFTEDDEDGTSETDSILLEDSEEFQLQLDDSELKQDDSYDVNNMGENWEILGKVAKSSYDDISEDKPNMDWALIDLHPPSLFRPNLFHISKGAGVYDILKGKLLRVPFYNIEDDRQVIVYSGSGTKPGVLSSIPSFIMLGPSQKFTETRNLTITNSERLKPGDCGAWVIDVSNHEILGHVAAADGFNEVYIIPIAATLRDMKRVLGAKIVDLALDSDISTWKDSHGIEEEPRSTITVHLNMTLLGFRRLIPQPAT